MDSHLLTTLSYLVGAIVAVIGFINKCIGDAKDDLHRRIDDLSDAHKEAQTDLKDQVSRIDTKVDLLIEKLEAPVTVIAKRSRKHNP